MATGTFYLRPCADIQLEHGGFYTLRVNPESWYIKTGTAYSEDTIFYKNAYKDISEEVCDEDSSYMSVVYLYGMVSSYPQEATSIFDMGYISGNQRVLSAKLCHVDKCKLSSENASIELNYKVSVNGVSSTFSYHEKKFSDFLTDTAEWQKFEEDCNGIVNAINDYIATNGSFPPVTVEIYSKVNGYANDKASSSLDTSQVYIELTCEEQSATGIGIHRKVNGEWKEAQKAFQKVSGAWVEISGEECKEILQNSFCTS